MQSDVIILGGGIAGLTTAATLLRGGLSPFVLDTASSVGGAVSTVRQDGFIAETGPNSLMLENDGTEEILRTFGIAPVEANPAAKKRFLVCAGKPVAAPASPFGAITTPLLSLAGKLRILAEPFAGKAREADESVAQFARRRLGADAFARLVDPMVAGIHAGDPEKLSLRAAFPRLRAMEQQYGSLLVAGLRKGRAAPVRRLVNFTGGMATIPEKLAESLGAARIQTGVEIISVETAGGTWSVQFCVAGKMRRVTARALVVAAPPRCWEKIPFPPALARHLRPWHALPAPPVGVISLGFRREQVEHPLDGFGMLAPAVEDRQILGTLFQSSLFPDRAPNGHVLLTTFIGGCRRPELARLDAPAQSALAAGELRRLLGIRGEPVFTHAHRHAHAIPQYDIGHEKLVSLLENAEHDCTGLYFCGNYRGGIAVGKTIFNAAKTAQKILRR